MLERPLQGLSNMLCLEKYWTSWGVGGDSAMATDTTPLQAKVFPLAKPGWAYAMVDGLGLPSSSTGWAGHLMSRAVGCHRACGEDVPQQSIKQLEGLLRMLGSLSHNCSINLRPRVGMAYLSLLQPRYPFLGAHAVTSLGTLSYCPLWELGWK